MKLTRPIITLLLCFAFTLSANGQLVHFTKQYTVENGLASRSITKIIRDDLGKSWLFSRYAIQLYDGATFKILKHNIPHNFEDEILIEKIGPSEILITKDTQAWVIDTAKESVSEMPINTNIKYFASENQLIEVNRDKKTIQIGDDSVIHNTSNLDINTIMTSGSDRLAILTNDSLLYYNYHQEEINQVCHADKLVGIIHDSLVYISQDSLFFYDPHSKSSIYQPAEKAIKYALVRKDKKGNAMLATSHNSRRYYHFTLYTSDQEYDYSEVSASVNTIRDFYSDNFFKDILVASYNGLLYHSFSNYVDKYNYDPNLNSSEFGNVIWWVIERESTGDIYFSKESKGFFKITKDTAHLVNPYQAGQSNTFTSNYFGTYHANSDRLYSLSLHQNHTILHSWNFEDDPVDINIAGRYFCLNATDDRYVSIGGRIDTTAQLITLDTKTNTIKSQESIAGIGKTIYHVEILDGYHYYGTNTGLYRIQQSSNHIDTLSQYASLCILRHKDQMIVGTDGYGLQSYQDGHLISSLDIDDGLVNNLVHSLTADNAGHIWASTDNGISVLDSNLQIIKNIRIEDGLTTTELNTKSLLQAGNKIYAGSINGLNAIDSSILDLQDSYPLVIDMVYTTDENDQTVSKNYVGYQQVDLEYGIENIEIDFHDYQLYKTVYDQDYLFQNQFTISDSIYTLDKHRLPVHLHSNTLGIDHKFGAINKRSNQNINITRQSFVQRYDSVILLSFLILLLLASLYFLNRKRIIERKNLELKSVNDKLTAMRASALRAQMNPHFIFNALGSIQYYIQRQEIEKAEEYLSDFSVLMRSTLESSKADYTKIGQEIEMLTLYLKLEHLRFEDKFEYSITIDESIDQSLKIPSMVIQPFIENAINHGVYHLTDRKGQVNLDIYENNDELIICKVVDNGIGRESSKQYRKKKHKSRALTNIDERINIMNNLNDKDLAIVVNDRIVEGRPEGTEVRIQFGIITV